VGGVMAQHSMGKGSYVISSSSYAIIAWQKTQMSVTAGSDFLKGKSEKKLRPLNFVDTNIEVNKMKHNNENDPG